MAAVQAHMRTLMKEVKARGLSDDDTSIAAYLQRIKDPATGRALLDDDRLAAEIGLFFFTGFETTGHTMAWTLYCLSRHPSELAKVEAELDQLGLLVTPERPSPRQIEYKDLSALQSLGRAIKEAMRLIPVVTATVRQSPSAIELGGYEIPANVPIFLLFYGLHNSERNWERPEEYCPDRWLQPGAEYW